MGGKGSGMKTKTFACGTVQRYRQHRRVGEHCAPCLKAANEYAKLRYKPKPKRPKLSIGAMSAKGVRNREIVRAEKFKRGSCLDCGLVIDERTIVCIDFDHRDPEDKSFTISYLMDKAHPSDIIAEMTKCDAVCRNCHALRTHAGKHWLYRRECKQGQQTLFDT
jgi:hypothetical protein